MKAILKDGKLTVQVDKPVELTIDIAKLADKIGGPVEAIERMVRAIFAE